jgi:hypothetical protein
MEDKIREIIELGKSIKNMNARVGLLKNNYKERIERLSKLYYRKFEHIIKKKTHEHIWKNMYDTPVRYIDTVDFDGFEFEIEEGGDDYYIAVFSSSYIWVPFEPSMDEVFIKAFIEHHQKLAEEELEEKKQRQIKREQKAYERLKSKFENKGIVSGSNEQLAVEGKAN